MKQGKVFLCVLALALAIGMAFSPMPVLAAEGVAVEGGQEAEAQETEGER